MTRGGPVQPQLPAEDYARIVDTYADRVNDVLRRVGAPPDAAAEITLTSAADLADAAAQGDPGTTDPAGWWFARALALGRRLGPQVEQGEPDAAGGADTGFLRDSEDDTAVREALDGLPDDQHLAVMLRDVYDLPPASVATVLGRDLESTAQTTADGRLALLAAYDGRPAPTLGGHSGRAIVTEGDLGLLADGGLDVDNASALRRHVSRCPACEDVLTALDRARRLAVGLPIIGIPDEDRDVVVPRLKDRAAAMLPSVGQMLLVLEDDDGDRPLVPPMVIVGVVSVALIAGIGVGAVLSQNGSGSPAAAVLPTSTPTPPPAHKHKKKKAAATPSPTPSPTPSRTPSPTPSPTPSQTPSPTPSPKAVPVSITIDPTSGPRGTVISVTGQGWTPGAQIVVEFLDSAGAPADTASVVANRSGRFHTTVTANDNLGIALDDGRRTVRASDGTTTRDKTFTLTP